MKSHVDTFVIISGDSDFSPLVSKLRENAKKVIGVGVKNSTSDLLVANCDEFIFYDDLVREQQRAAAKRESREASAATKRPADEDKHPKAEMEARKAQAIAIAVETFDALASERGESGKIWASVLKSAIKRRKPDFSESYYGFRAFGNLLDEAQARGLLEVGRDDKSGAFVYRSSSVAPETARAALPVASAPAHETGALAETTGNKGRKRGKGARNQARDTAPNGGAAQGPASPATAIFEEAPAFEPELHLESAAAEAASNRSTEAFNAAIDEPVDEAAAAPKPRRARKSSAKTAGSAGSTGAKKSPRQAAIPAAPTIEPAMAWGGEPEAEPKPKAAKTPRKSSARTARARKPSA